MDEKEKTIANFNKNAAAYDTGSFYRFPRKLRPLVLSEIEAAAYSSLLDVGCGTGALLSQLSAQRPDAAYFGLDISENMLAQAREKLPPSVVLTLGDAENLPYPDRTFDVVSCTESFHHYPNPGRALSEMRRVLRDGGRFILCDTWIVPPLRPILNFTFRFGSRGDVRVYSRGEIIALLRGAGFREVRWQRAAYYAYLCTGLA